MQVCIVCVVVGSGDPADLIVGVIPIVLFFIEFECFSPDFSKGLVRAVSGLG